MQDFSLTFKADVKHVSMVFSEILPQNHLNNDTDLSVQRKPGEPMLVRNYFQLWQFHLQVLLDVFNFQWLFPGPTKI